MLHSKQTIIQNQQQPKPMPTRLSQLLLLFFLLLSLTTCSYLEMQLIRSPQQSELVSLSPVQCNTLSVSNEADYKELCYEKDITYSIPFIIEDTHYSLAADFTTPISWIKGKSCKIQGTGKRCQRLTQTVVEKMKAKGHSSRLHRKAEHEIQENAVIEGSSQQIRGEIEKDRNLTLTVKDSSRLNNLLELIMLGLFIYGEKDNLTLTKTNFVNATSITPNLNSLSDGAISMRFDNTAENSFLDEIFTYAQAVEKAVTIGLADSGAHLITIGDLTAKNTDKGYPGIQWISMPDEEDYGRLPELTSIGLDDILQDKQQDTLQALPAVITLSASYLSFPQQIITKAITSQIGSESICKVSTDNYLQCSSSSKKKLQRLIDKQLVLGFQGCNMIIPLKKLVLKLDHNKRVIFNIKKSISNVTVLGEPIFNEYFMAFDYLKNRIGFSQKKEEIDEFMFEVVSLVRFLCSVMVFGCCFICCYEPCSQVCKKSGRAKREQRNRNRRERESRSQSQLGEVESSGGGSDGHGYNPLSETGRTNIFDEQPENVSEGVSENINESVSAPAANESKPQPELM